MHTFSFLCLRIVSFIGLSCVFLTSSDAQDRYAEARERLVRDRIASAGVTDPRVLDAIRQTPRHEFVPRAQRAQAYLDMALPIGESQTISSPFIVASMTEALSHPLPSEQIFDARSTRLHERVDPSRRWFSRLARGGPL